MPVIQLDLDSTGAVRSISNYNDAADAAGKKTDTAFGKIRRWANDIGPAVVLGVGAATAAVIAFGFKLIQMASTMEETQGKFDVVFRGMESTAEAWAATLNESYGISEQAAKQYLSSLQDLIVPTGMAREAAGEFSNQFVKMARDLASFNNLKTADVVRDIQSALAGGAETMLKYGINVKQSKIEQEAFRLGLINSKAELSDAIKVQAIYSIMMREGADAVGDFARTADSFANQQEKLKAQLQDISTEIGMKLLPVATQLITALNEWIKGTNAVNIAMLYTVKTVRFVHDGIAGLILIGDTLVHAFAVTFDFLVNGFFSMIKPLNLIGDALAKMGAIKNNPFEKLQAAAANFKESSADVLSSQVAYIEKSASAFDKLENKIKGSTKAQKELTSTATQGATQIAQAYEATVGALPASIKKVDGAWTNASAAAEDAAKRTETSWLLVDGVWEEVIVRGSNLIDALDATGAAAVGAAANQIQAQEGVATTADRVADSTKNVESAMLSLDSQATGVNATIASQANAYYEAAAATDQMTESVNNLANAEERSATMKTHHLKGAVYNTGDRSTDAALRMENRQALYGGAVASNEVVFGGRSALSSKQVQPGKAGADAADFMSSGDPAAVLAGLIGLFSEGMVRDTPRAESKQQAGTTVVINQRVGRSDINSIISETYRQRGRS